MIGPGKYDELATFVRETTKAVGVVVIVSGGEQGDGFAVQAPLELHLALPAMLRDMAAQIEQHHAKGEL